TVPVYPWSASQCGSPQLAGSRSTLPTAPQPTVSTTSRGSVPRTCFAGSSTTLVTTTVETRSSRTVSVEVEAYEPTCESTPSSSGSVPCSSVWPTTSRRLVSASTVTWRRTSSASKVVSWWTRWLMTGSPPSAVSTASATSAG